MFTLFEAVTGGFTPISEHETLDDALTAASALVEWHIEEAVLGGSRIVARSETVQN